MQGFRNKGLKKAFTNTASQFVAKGLTAGASFLFTLGVSYFLGLDTLGSITKIIAFVSIFYLFVDFGFNAIFLKDIQNSEKNFGNLFFLRVLITIATIGLIALITLFLPSGEKGYSPFEKIGIFLFSLTLFTQSFLLSVNAIFQKHLRYTLLLIPQSVAFVAFLVVLVLGIFFKNTYLLLSAYFISGVFFCLIAYPLVVKQYHISTLTHNFVSVSKKLLISSAPLGIMLAFNLVYFRIDTIILALYHENTAVGIYGLSYKFFEFIVVIPTFFANSIYPVLLAKQSNPKDFTQHIKSYAFILAGVSVVFTIAVLIFAPFLELIREEFGQSVLPLQILAFAFPLFFLTSLLQWVMIINNQKKKLLLIYFFSMIVNVILNLIFIPQYSYIAAAITTAISELVVLVLILFSIFVSLKAKFI